MKSLKLARIKTKAVFGVKTVATLSLMCAALVPASNISAREKPLSVVQDLRYGSALYQYYLDDYMAALSDLLVAEQQGGISGHGDNPEIMEGGLALGYNMERYATEIFDRLLEENRSVEVRDTAWYFLAKLRYAKQEWDRAEEALNKISRKPVKTLREDAAALRLNVYLKQNKPRQAAALLKEARLTDRWLPYFYFNVGSAFARQSDFAEAVKYFMFLAQEQYQSEEYRALYDKAMTAAGYAYLFQKSYADAISVFSRVRLTSALSNRALLGYGWAAAEMGNYEEALKPWLHLSKSDLIDENNQEAMIAVPYAYEKIGSEALALRYYQNAEKSFAEEINKIDAVLVSLKNEELLDALKVQQRGQLDWLGFAEEQQLSPRLSYLVQLFSRDQFQGSIQEFQDLLALQENLYAWQRKLNFYSETIDERLINRTEKEEFLSVSSLENRLNEMRAQRKSLSQEIERVAAERDFFSLSTGDENDLISRVKRSEENITILRDSDPFIEEYEETVRRYKGLLLWQTSEQFGDRLWQSIKTLNQLDAVIQEASDTETRVVSLMETAPDLDPYQRQIQEAQSRLSALLENIEEAISRNEIDLKLQVVRILNGQRGRLSNYLAQSRLSVARLYDKANQASLEPAAEPLSESSEQEAQQ